jgi:hypothetical protein
MYTLVFSQVAKKIFLDLFHMRVALTKEYITFKIVDFSRLWQHRSCKEKRAQNDALHPLYPPALSKFSSDKDTSLAGAITRSEPFWLNKIYSCLKISRKKHFKHVPVADFESFFGLFLLEISITYCSIFRVSMHSQILFLKSNTGIIRDQRY